jgi:hypothetical protein
MKTDINETEMLLQFDENVFNNMLKDHTTQQNIYWATDSYAKVKKEGYGFFDAITIEKITGENEGIIRPRAVKSEEEKSQRVKDKAEVFTPSWICNAQNNLVDEAWFGRRNVFNQEVTTPEGVHTWETNPDPIDFIGVPDHKDWRDYVADRRLEITCGEAPYLVNRYDSVTGKYNEDIQGRIGILDRKLRIVSENTETSADWLLWGKIALRATYGFEWQGDNLLLAREGLFYTFLEHYKAKFDKAVPKRSIPGVAYIISWNIWQMDGLTFGLPGRAPTMPFFSKKYSEIEDGIEPYNRFCLVKDFIGNHNLHNSKLSNHIFADLKAKKVIFQSLLDNK